MGGAQAKLDAEKAEREKIRFEQLEARRAKLEHQDRETQDLINKQGQKPPKPKPREPENKKKKEKPKTVIKTFRALNESDNEEDGYVSPLYKDSHPELYDDTPATQEAEPQEESDSTIEIEIPGRAVYADENDVEVGSEESIEVEEIRNESDDEDEYEVP